MAAHERGAKTLRHLTRLTLCLAVLGLLGCSHEEDEPASTPAPVDVQPMPASGHRVEWGTPGVPCTMKAGSTVAVAVVVTNAGDQTWRDIPNSQEGKGAVRLGYRWWAAGNAKTPAVDYGHARGDLAAPLPPGGSAPMTVKVVAPAAPGAYLLQLDLVEELVVWFEVRGANRLVVPVTVG